MSDECRLVMTSQQLLWYVNPRTRVTKRHIYSHGVSVENERVDHAAALGAIGLVSKHNVSGRCVQPSFNTQTLSVGATTLIIFSSVYLPLGDDTRTPAQQPHAVRKQ